MIIHLTRQSQRIAKIVFKTENDSVIKYKRDSPLFLTIISDCSVGHGMLLNCNFVKLTCSRTVWGADKL